MTTLACPRCDITFVTIAEPLCPRCGEASTTTARAWLVARVAQGLAEA